MLDEDLRKEMEQAYIAGEYDRALVLSTRFDEQVLLHMKSKTKYFRTDNDIVSNYEDAKNKF